VDTLIAPQPAAPEPRPPRRPGRGPLIALVAILGLIALAGGWALARASTAPRPLTDPTPVAAPQSGIAGAVGVRSAGAHLEALQRVADQNGGNRAAGTPGYAASVEYVVGVLRAAGWDVRTEPFQLGGASHHDDTDHDDTDRDDTDRDEERRAGRTDVNVIAQTRTGDPNRVVLAGAHLDSVAEGPGINDNATGVAALLDIATALGGAPDVPNALRFAFWGGEEDGMIGSSAYVEGLSRAERKTVRAYVNLDMLASTNGGYFVQGGVGDDEEESGPAASAEIAKLLVEQLRVAGVEAENVEFDGGSDFVPFAEAGIPTAGVAAGDGQRKSRADAARWGGEAGEVHDPCYHRACDTLANVDPTKFEAFTDAVAATLVRLATG
jgi:Predicted aminopeptidases